MSKASWNKNPVICYQIKINVHSDRSLLSHTSFNYSQFYSHFPHKYPINTLIENSIFFNKYPINTSFGCLKKDFFNNLFNNQNSNNLFIFQSLENNLFCLFDCLFVCLENSAVQPNSEKLAVQPNHEKPGGPNFPSNKKIFLSSFGYNLLNKHVEHFDQQMKYLSLF